MTVDKMPSMPKPPTLQPQDIHHAVVEDPGRQQVQGKLSFVVDHGVSGVAGAAGNVTVVGSGELNMYGNGIIKGGAAIGSAPAGANIAVTGASAVLNLGEAALEGGIVIIRRGKKKFYMGEFA